MIRISTIFIAVCVALIAASIGVGAFYVLQFDLLQSAIVSVAVFAVMTLYHALFSRPRQRGDVSSQIADLSRGTADLARQVAEYGRRLGALETKLASDNGNSRASIEPLSNEITELGAIVRQLAHSVAAHEDALGGKSASPSSAEASGETSVAFVGPSTALEESIATLQEPRTDRLVLATPGAGDAADARQTADALAASPSPVQTATDSAVMIARIRNAIESNRLDLYLQPLVTLPQRKVRFYEAMSRLRDETGTPIAANDFIGIAENIGQMPRIDHMVIFRCVQVLRRLQVKTKDVGLFCNLSRKTLGDGEVFGQCLDFLQANRALAPALVFEFRQEALRNLVPLESEHLARLSELGFRLSLDHVTDLRIDPRELADLGVKFVKVPAKTLLEGTPPGLDIHPADLSDLLGRFGIDLVAEKIEGEKSVVDLLDYDVRYGQGFLFSPPRPLRPDNADPGPPGVAPPPAPAAASR